MEIKFIAKASGKADVSIFFTEEKGKLSESAAAADKKTGGLIKKIAGGKVFTGKFGETHHITTADENYMLAGLGEIKELTNTKFENLGGKIVAALNAQKIAKAEIIVELPKSSKITADIAAARIAFGAKLRSYRFDKYRTKEKAEDKPTLKALHIVVSDNKAAEKAFIPLDKLAVGTFLTRDLVSEPANIIYPESFAEKCKELASYGINVKILGEKELKKLGCGSLLGVGQGSSKESKMVIMEYMGGDKKDDKIAFIGKGVTFDTGGISIKPSNGMEDMKWDMGGAGVVAGLMLTLAARGAKVNAVGAVGLVENMPSGDAQRPGDVVTSMSGQTIEVLNTDAEGRLVLADVLHYVQENYKPTTMVDLATLTGAIIIALGSHMGGLFANDDTLAKQIEECGKETGERFWRLPLDEDYNKMLDSQIADMQNITNTREGGSITAAQFLQRFVQDGVKWAHLDIAGVTWISKDKDIIPKGATAHGLRLLDLMVQKYYEKN